ncbi:MAG: MOSC N-terminal beta barrel domain-containing protein [Gammaproteobacteria bacterium]|nr:MOSC N-terminal beta barrel domain-containing protein [Gammaproteobacteria bacterium]
MISLSRIFIYPIKSTAPLELLSSEVEAEGLAHDRRYVVTDEKGRFFTARRFPRMVLIHTELAGDGLHVSAPAMPDLELNPRDFSADYGPVKVWQDTVQAQSCGNAADQWFSDYLGLGAKLYYMGKKSRRPTRADGVVSFADSAPLLLLSESSVEDLNTRLDTAVNMKNFRPNLVVTGSDAYAEDDWGEFSIGGVNFDALWRCSRCVLTTVNPDTAAVHPQRQPLTTLMDYRRADDGETYFGLNVAAKQRGSVHVGQPLVFS